MKVALATWYRGWMFALFPATLGLGTAALWLRSRNWPLVIDETGVRFRSHRYVDWGSVTKISVSRGCLDGHVSQMRIHHGSGVVTVPVGGLEDGQSVVDTMIFMFKQMNGGISSEERMDGVVLPIPTARQVRLAAVPHQEMRSESDTSQRETGRNGLMERRKPLGRLINQEQT